MTFLPSNILKCMSKSERAKLGKGNLTASECQAKIDVKSERELQRLISSWLRLQGIWFHCARTDKRTTGQRGTPDYLLAVRLPIWADENLMPVPIAIEVKFDKGKLSPEQERVKTDMIASGWQYYEVRSLEEVIAIIKG